MVEHELILISWGGRVLLSPFLAPRDRSLRCCREMIEIPLVVTERLIHDDAGAIDHEGLRNGVVGAETACDLSVRVSQERKSQTCASIEIHDLRMPFSQPDTDDDGLRLESLVDFAFEAWQFPEAGLTP